MRFRYFTTKRHFIILSIAFLLVPFISQSQKKQPATYVAIAVSSDTTVSASCPFLSTDHKGNTVLSWVKEITKSKGILNYVVSTSPNSSTFGSPIEIPSSNNLSFHGENMPKVIFKPNGEIIAVWGANNPNPKNKYSGLVYYSQSFDDGQNWTNATALVTDTAGYDQRYFDVAILKNGEAAIIWLDNRKRTDQEGSAIFFATTNGKKGFENEFEIAETCCPCCRTEMHVDSKGDIHIVNRAILDNSIRDMVHRVSTDNGNTFSAAARISKDNWKINGCPHTGPTMTENKSGLHFAWYTMGDGDGIFYCNSTDNGKSYSSRMCLSGKESGKHPQITALENENIVVVWDEAIQVGENYNRRIRLQYQTAKGKTIRKQYITTKFAVADYPVIKMLDHENILVAYSQKENNKKNVFYQVINLK